LSQIVGGDVLDAPQNIELLPYGEIADKYINQLNDFYDNIEIVRYVIMPNHIHIMLIVLDDGSPRTSTPTRQTSVVSHFVSTLKRFCNKEYGENIWQRHFNDHIIRNYEDYELHLRYIAKNPLFWDQDELSKN
jgi:REP element-mobilizing transposase RayT